MQWIDTRFDPEPLTARDTVANSRLDTFAVGQAPAPPMIRRLRSCQLVVGCPPLPPPVPSSPVAAYRSPIRRILCLIKESRPFDQYFGTFPGADGATSGVISTGEGLFLGHARDRMPQDSVIR